MRLSIEVGGTSIRVACTRTQKLNEEIQVLIENKVIIENTGYDAVLSQIFEHLEGKEITSIGISSFGPLCLDKSSEKFGAVLSGACDIKKTWLNKSLALDLSHRLSITLDSVFVDTDVNGACIAERVLGKHPGVLTGCNLAYITVGTGVGVGIEIEGRTIKGIQHPEAGHLICQLHPKDIETNFNGPCNFHDNCIENFTTNYSIAQRLGITIHQLPDVPDDHEVWEIVSFYLAQLCHNIALMVSPKAIVLGGGIMKRKVILDTIQSSFLSSINGYIQVGNIENYIRKAQLSDSGLYGAALLK